MRVSRSGYYKFLQGLSQQPSDHEELVLLVALKVLQRRSHNSYGSLRMAKALQMQGYAVGRYRARSLMRKAGIICLQRRRYGVTTKSQEGLAVAKNQLNRQFSVDAPNRVWVVDITYLDTKEGWLYLAIVLDLFSRRVIGWSLADHLQEALVGHALQMAITRRQPTGYLMHHSDRGSQYTSKEYQARLTQLGATVSMSRAGQCYDNAVAERFFGSLKSERTDHEVYQTRAHAKSAVIDYIEDFYNSHRLHSTLGYLSPITYEKASGFS